MDAMDVLERCRAATRELASLRGRAARLQEVAYSPGGHGGDGTGSRSTRERDRMAAYVAAQDSIARAIKARELDMQTEELASAMLIDRALCGHDQHAAVMHAYYIRRQSYKEAAAQLHLSASRVKNIRLEAVALVQEISEADVDALLPPDYNHREEDTP